MRTNKVLSSSFRDPSGFLYEKKGTLYRQVNKVYKDDYDLLMDSGLYCKLLADGLIVQHSEKDLSLAVTEEAYKVIEPQKLLCISYPYEWCFAQLKAAALLTLKVQKIALDHGMSLKDASAYNVQFSGSQAVLIDTLSFEQYQENTPWIAYKQFCQHFLAPLTLMAKVDVAMNKMLRNYIDGIPLDLAVKLLPFMARFDVSSFIHLVMHSKSQKKYADKNIECNNLKFSKVAMLGLIDSLEGAVKKLKLGKAETEWGDYYNNTNYSSESFSEKQKIISAMFEKVNVDYLWDLGGNDGTFSRIAAEKGIYTVSFDIDPVAVSKNYERSCRDNSKTILPLVLDLVNPSPGIGWANNERESLTERESPDIVMALALVHHLAISNNLPLEKIASYFSSLAKYLIIEFVPKEDSQVRKLLSTRKDIFINYNLDGFMNAFNIYYEIVAVEDVKDSCRTIFLMRSKDEK